MRTTIFSSLLLVVGFFSSACSSSSAPVERNLQFTSLDDSTAEALALPNCDSIGKQSSTTTTPVIHQVSGSESLYVLVLGTTALCSGEFTDVADSVAAQAGLVFDTEDWSGSNPMPGRTGLGGSNPMPGAPASGQEKETEETPEHPSRDF